MLSYHRKRGSASYIVREVRLVRERERYRERERERERNGNDATVVALKLVMSLHFPLPKVRTIGDEFTLSLAKNSHFLYLPSHFPSLPSSMVTIVALKPTMSSHFPLPKHFTLFVPTLSNGMSRATSDQIPKTSDQILPIPKIVLPIEKMNQINTKTSTWLLEIEKKIVREVARGDKSYLRKSTDREAQISPERLPSWFVLCDL